MRKTLDIAGLGNALVDLQVLVEDDFIEKFSIKKGEMRLIDDAFKNEILAGIDGSRINICSGGSGANSIVAFGALGGKAGYNTILGNDKFGHFYANEFKELDIELKAPFIDEKGTGVCTVLISPDGERTMLTSLSANTEFNEKHLNEELYAKSKWSYLEGYKLDSPNPRDAVFSAAQMCKDNDTKIAFTFSDVFIIENFREHCEKLAEKSDLVFCNENEAMVFTQTDNTEDAMKKLTSIVPNVAITLGKEGSMFYANKQKYVVPPYPAVRLDTTGAGDMFAGAFMYGMLYFNNIEHAGHLASLASAKIVSVLGARLKEDPKNLISQLKV